MLLNSFTANIHKSNGVKHYVAWQCFMGKKLDNEKVISSTRMQFRDNCVQANRDHA